MRKLAALSIAVLASFALAGAASATIVMSIVGSNNPGTNSYNIVLSIDSSDNVVGYLLKVSQTGSFGGVAANLTPAPFGNGSGILSLTPCSNCDIGLFGAVTGVNGVAPTGTYTVGSLTLTVAAGDTINPTYSFPAGGITTYNGTVSATIQPTNLNGITIVPVPEPTTASLLGLGTLGLILAGRKRRA